LSVFPKHPRAGSEVRVELRTYVPVVDSTRRCRFRPVPQRVRYPFHAQAEAPDGRIVRVRFRQARSNLYIALLRVDVPGRWTLRVTNFGPRYDACSGAVFRFRVVRR
jgi:hypothetical protein